MGNNPMFPTRFHSAFYCVPDGTDVIIVTDKICIFTPALRKRFFIISINMEDLKVTLIQTELHWENRNKNLKMFEEKITQINQKTDLIILPEMFNSGFTMNTLDVAEKMDGESINWMSQQASKYGCVITGSLIIEENGMYFNRLIWMDAKGNYQIYNKRHLFRIANEQHYFESGNEKIIVVLKGWKICPLICYDLRFPVWSRNKASGPKTQDSRHRTQEYTAYDVLIYVANWPERRNAHWKLLLPARAIENQAYVVGVNRVGKDRNEISYSGDSIVIHPRGEALSNLKAQEDAIETIILNYSELEELRKSFPVGLDADDFETFP